MRHYEHAGLTIQDWPNVKRASRRMLDERAS